MVITTVWHMKCLDTINCPNLHQTCLKLSILNAQFRITTGDTTLDADLGIRSKLAQITISIPWSRSLMIHLIASINVTPSPTLVSFHTEKWSSQTICIWRIHSMRKQSLDTWARILLRSGTWPLFSLLSPIIATRLAIKNLRLYLSSSWMRHKLPTKRLTTD